MEVTTVTDVIRDYLVAEYFNTRKIFHTSIDVWQALKDNESITSVDLVTKKLSYMARFRDKKNNTLKISVSKQDGTARKLWNVDAALEVETDPKLKTTAEKYEAFRGKIAEESTRYSRATTGSQSSLTAPKEKSNQVSGEHGNNTEMSERFELLTDQLEKAISALTISRADNNRLMKELSEAVNRSIITKKEVESWVLECVERMVHANNSNLTDILHKISKHLMTTYKNQEILVEEFHSMNTQSYASVQIEDRAFERGFLMAQRLNQNTQQVSKLNHNATIPQQSSGQPLNSLDTASLW